MGVSAARCTHAVGADVHRVTVCCCRLVRAPSATRAGTPAAACLRPVHRCEGVCRVGLGCWYTSIEVKRSAPAPGVCE